jgi:ketosteroid isomerase-like protein
VGESELEAVFDHFHARRRRDIGAVAAGLDPRVVHQGVEPDLVCDGRDEVLERVRRSFSRVPSGIDGIELIDAGDSVVVGLSGQQFRDNPLLEGRLFMVFTVREGVITRIEDYRTREQAMLAAQAGKR